MGSYADGIQYSTVRTLDTIDTIKSVGKKVSAFASGVVGSLVRGAFIKPSEVLYPFALQERFVRHIGIDVPEVFTKEIDDYTDATDRFVLRMAGKVEDWTLYYAGRCTGDALYTAAGIIEGAYGTVQAISGGAGVIAAVMSGGGTVLIPEALAVAVQGVAIATDSLGTITQGLDMMQEDLGRYQQSKKEAEDEEYYKKGLQEIPDDWVEVEVPEEYAVKSESFKNFLREQGYNPKNWRKVVEKWASPDGTIYQRHYWTNGKIYYYHGDGIEVFVPH